MDLKKKKWQKKYQLLNYLRAIVFWHGIMLFQMSVESLKRQVCHGQGSLQAPSLPCKDDNYFQRNKSDLWSATYLANLLNSMICILSSTALLTFTHILLHLLNALIRVVAEMY